MDQRITELTHLMYWDHLGKWLKTWGQNKKTIYKLMFIQIYFYYTYINVQINILLNKVQLSSFH